jgi:hypothetical protein
VLLSCANKEPVRLKTRIKLANKGSIFLGLKTRFIKVILFCIQPAFVQVAVFLSEGESLPDQVFWYLQASSLFCAFFAFIKIILG